jgi:hypothetical protein
MHQIAGIGDPSLVRHVLVVGNHRWSGDLSLPRSARVGRRATSLWSDVVVRCHGHQLGRDRLLEDIVRLPRNVAPLCAALSPSNGVRRLPGSLVSGGVGHSASRS